MKGVIGKAIAGLGCAAGLAGAGGCYTYRDIVDPCYPERYWFTSRKAVNAAFAPQVYNGHVLDQTVWNYHFEEDEAGRPTARLTGDGQRHLAYLARRRPHADPVIFLQTAHDVPYDPANPEALVARRAELDEQRRRAILTYLTAQAVGGRCQDFQVVVHNPPPLTGKPGPYADILIRQYYVSPRATLPGVAGGGATGATGVGGAGAAVPPAAP